jgi:Asp-tRNA(Asn)/Glu-tRNA(Gln) amidotransferase A subunit family amidase
MTASLIELAQVLRAGEKTLIDYLDELEAHFEAREPDVLAFLPEEGRFERLRADAQALLKRYPDPAARPPLFGVPVGVKDIFHVEGFITRAGTQVPAEHIQGSEAESVTRLKAAGALILGKAVTTVFAYFAPGPTRNPHNPEHTPGGSSSGSAAAVGAGLCPVALGTQTIGSINRPAAFCGAVGYKPSYERISREGVIPLSPSVDHIGFFTTDVAGAELVASVLVADWKAVSPGDKPTLSIPEGPYLERASDEGQAHFRQTCQRLAESGYEVKSVPAMHDFDDILTHHNQVVAADAAQVHAKWYSKFKDVYHFKTVELIERGHSVSAETLAEGLKGREQLRGELATLMDEHGVDLWVSPSAPGPAPKGLDSTGDPIMNLPWTHAGLPTVTVPAGVNADGLPLGLQLAGDWHGDEALMRWAASIENAVRD